MTDQPRFALVAGESSGDLLGEDLIRSLRQRFPNARFAGIGGPMMKDAGQDCWFDASELAVMGLAEVLGHLPRLLSLRRQVHQRILDWKADCFIGIDAPDFNLGLERKLRKSGLTTVHYVSPSIWAWRPGRVHKIGRSADRILTLFPFEPEIYQRHGIDASFVGHPLATAFPEQPETSSYRQSLGLPADQRLLAVLPGSRLGEIERMGPVFARCMALLANEDLAFIAPAATPLTGNKFQAMVNELAPKARVHWLQGQSREAMLASDAVLLASGTAALEAMLAKRPMVVAYRIARLTYWIVKGLGLMRIDHYSLPNVLAGRQMVPEILQDQMTPERLSETLRPLLQDPQAGREQTAEFLELHRSLVAEPGAHAAAVAALLDGSDR
jgi:lipid-A-disaccharide synthase